MWLWIVISLTYSKKKCFPCDVTHSKLTVFDAGIILHTKTKSTCGLPVQTPSLSISVIVSLGKMHYLPCMRVVRGLCAATVEMSQYISSVIVQLYENMPVPRCFGAEPAFCFFSCGVLLNVCVDVWQSRFSQSTM